MKQINELITSKDLSKPQAEKQGVTGRIDLAEFDIDLIDYIFHKIRLTWGDGKFKGTFPDEKTLSDTKRDWAKDLLRTVRIKRGESETDTEYAFRIKSKIDGIFQDIRFMATSDSKWEWPSLRLLCGYMANSHACAAHRTFRSDRALPDKSKQDRAKQARDIEIKKLRGLFK